MPFLYVHPHVCVGVCAYSPHNPMVEGIERIQSVQHVGFQWQAAGLKGRGLEERHCIGAHDGFFLLPPFIYVTISLSSVYECCVRGTRSWLSSSEGLEKVAWAEFFLRPRLAEGAVDEGTLLLPFSLWPLARNGLASSSVDAKPTFCRKKDNSFLACCTFTTAWDKPPMQLSKWSLVFK